VLSGEATNLHQAMIASQESSVSFTLMVELRNKLVESYQELMRAQVYGAGESLLSLIG
jgi:flagellar hook-basal body complex protein FliE